MSQSASHFCQLSKFPWSCMASAALLMYMYKTQSSAKCRTAELSDTMSGRTLMKSKNTNGPRTLPWGTPDLTGAVMEVTPSSNTCCVCHKEVPYQPESTVMDAIVFNLILKALLWYFIECLR